jgi:hypothetical protein
MSREVFLTIVAGVAVCIGVFAAALPHRLLDSKGVTADPATKVWVREVGVLIAAIGVTAFLVRGQPDSPTLRALLIGNAIVQLGLLPIEVIAYARRVITKLSGIAPNTVLHAALAAGFTYYAWAMT